MRFIWWLGAVWQQTTINVCQVLPVSQGHIELTQWGWDKMATIFQMTSSNIFSWIKMNEFQSTFHKRFFLRVQLTIFQHWFGAKPWSEPKTVCLLMHICVIRPQWVKWNTSGLICNMSIIIQKREWGVKNYILVTWDNYSKHRKNFKAIVKLRWRNFSFSSDIQCALYVSNIKTINTQYSVVRYNQVNVLPNPHNRHPITCQWGWGMVCLF